MADPGKFDLFAAVERADNEDRQSYEEYMRDNFCIHKPQDGNHEYEKRVLLLSINEGVIELVCPGCKKQPPWMDEFIDGVSMGYMTVTSVLTSDRGHYPDYEPDGPYTELTFLDTGTVPPQDEPK